MVLSKQAVLYSTQLVSKLLASSCTVLHQTEALCTRLCFVHTATGPVILYSFAASKITCSLCCYNVVYIIAWDIAMRQTGVMHKVRKARTLSLLGSKYRFTASRSLPYRIIVTGTPLMAIQLPILYVMWHRKRAHHATTTIIE